MARRRQINGVKAIDTLGGLIWFRNSGLGHYERGNYETERFHVRYELEKRKWSPQEPDGDTGWYLYSFNAPGGFFGVWCGYTIMEAADLATEMILRRDLKGGRNA